MSSRRNVFGNPPANKKARQHGGDRDRRQCWGNPSTKEVPKLSDEQAKASHHSTWGNPVFRHRRYRLDRKRDTRGIGPDLDYMLTGEKPPVSENLLVVED